jgi:hypothetical protein
MRGRGVVQVDILYETLSVTHLSNGIMLNSTKKLPERLTEIVNFGKTRIGNQEYNLGSEDQLVNLRRTKGRTMNDKIDWDGFQFKSATNRLQKIQ